MTNLKNIRPIYFFIVLLADSYSSIAFSATNNEFPGRDIYPLVSVIELKELFSRFNEFIVVDVRSAYEYETLRIKGARNISLSAHDFVARMRKLRVKDPRPIIVYCNGKTCMKSYKAALKCANNKIDNVHSYDAGVMDWARAKPNLAVLLGKSPVNPKHIISKKQFKKHLLSPDAYGDKVASTSAIVLDVRDRFQREGLSIFIGRERRAYLDDKKKLDKYIKKAKSQNKTLLIHDAAGKQVRWLQYYLEEKGLRSYYFMEDGVAAYYNEMKADFIR